MGFQRQAYKLKWPDDSRWSGLEVRLRGMNIGELEDIAKLQAEVGKEESLERVKPILDVLETALLSWNLEDDDGAPVPIGAFRNEDLTMLMAIVSAWTEVVGDVPAPLKQPSSDGRPSEEALMPMEIPSSSQQSSSTPN